jgi:hypothetical protein
MGFQKKHVSSRSEKVHFFLEESVKMCFQEVFKKIQIHDFDFFENLKKSQNNDLEFWVT